MTTAVHLHVVSVMHTTPLPPHMQQELVTSRIIPEFAEEVAEGGEMVRKETGREGGRKEGGREGGRKGGRKGERKEYIIMMNFCCLHVMERWLCFNTVKVQMHSI